MKILAIDTATEGCSVTLQIDTAQISEMQVVPRKHAELILPMIDSVLSQAQLSLSALDALAFGRGPGAFTGVRIATGVIQGLAYGADLPVVPVSTLRALAQRVFNQHQQRRVMTAFDARMDEVYWGCWQTDQHDIMQAVAVEQVIAPDRVERPAEWSDDETVTAAGSGWLSYADVLMAATRVSPDNILADLISRADEIAQLAMVEFKLGNAVPAEQALPVYLRNQVAWKKTGV